ncbi:MAG: hypothetical protein HY650_06015 [Acidobacteria bacterium]|nr:hypothetical protein [Acidobacteriota bacterium]
MTKKRSELDINQIAAEITKAATSPDMLPMPKTPEGKNAAAVALGRLGGQKGGPARAKSLSAKKRSAIAKKAAKARWGKG